MRFSPSLPFTKQTLYFRALNGSANDTHWMMGNSLNPSSNMVKEMAVALDAESKMYGVALGDTKSFKETTGVPFPKRRRVRDTIRRPVFSYYLLILRGGAAPQVLA